MHEIYSLKLVEKDAVAPKSNREIYFFPQKTLLHSNELRCKHSQSLAKSVCANSSILQQQIGQLSIAACFALLADT